jgi:Arginine repressor
LSQYIFPLFSFILLDYFSIFCENSFAKLFKKSQGVIFMKKFTRKEKKEEAKKIIYKYIEKHKNEKTYISSKNQIYNELNEEFNELSVSKASVYRYMKEMNCKKIGNGKFDFVKDDALYFNTLLQRRFYTNRLYFHISTPALGSYIAYLLNKHYEEQQHLIYFVALQDLLICYYKKKKNSNNGLIAKEIEEKIGICLENHILHLKKERFEEEYKSN